MYFLAQPWLLCNSRPWSDPRYVETFDKYTMHESRLARYTLAIPEEERKFAEDPS